jgi:aspartyl-tRNA(Asn)/glutamyl-tRNA(Gln) amidotransferase subunit B
VSWESVIGLEIHAQLATRSKIFSGASTTFGAPPNANACAVDLGLPGVLPVLNAEAVRMAVMFGLAVGAEIAERCIFARKNYFYPDLPKGYQISQYEQPIVRGGHVVLELEAEAPLRVDITRAHLEEDAGKSVHDVYQGQTGIDLNRAGTPLLEIVSEPDLRSASQAAAYMRAIHSIVRYLGICDGNMQEGSFRCDANVSIRRTGDTALGTRTELKNLNSFRFLERAIEFEIERQVEVLEGGGKVVQETRLYDPDRQETRPMRGKEEANDYRYFPDPDLLPVLVDAAFIQSVRAALPELADAKRDRFVETYGVSDELARQLVASRDVADFFEAVVAASGGLARQAAHWIVGEVAAALNRNETEIAQAPVDAEALAAILRRVEDGTLSASMAKQVFEGVWNGEGDPDTVIDARGLRQVTDSGAIEAMVEQVLAANPGQIEQFRAGKQKVLGFLVGQVMKASAGKADPKQVNVMLREKLKG